MRFQGLAVVCMICALGIACGGISSPSNNPTESFTGMLVVGGSNSHTFNVGKTGEFSVKITAVSPDANAILGVGYGQPFGTVCAFFSGFNNVGRVGSPVTVLSGGIQKGTYCIGVYDAGFLTQTENYTFTVSHP